VSSTDYVGSVAGLSNKLQPNRLLKANVDSLSKRKRKKSFSAFEFFEENVNNKIFSMHERLPRVKVPADQRPGHAEHLQLHIKEQQVPHDFPRAQGALQGGAARGVLGPGGVVSQKPVAEFRVPL
jgi:hypothetical protein